MLSFKLLRLFSGCRSSIQKPTSSIFNLQKNLGWTSSHLPISCYSRLFERNSKFTSSNLLVKKGKLLRVNFPFDKSVAANLQNTSDKDINARILTIPNLLSLFRIIASPFIGYFIIIEDYSFAFNLFAVASLTDMLDGAIARRWPSQRSYLGTVIDPLGDKFLVLTACGCLTYANIIPLYLTLLFLAKDLGLILVGLYVRYKTCPPPVTLRRFMDPSMVNVEVTASTMSKVNTFLQMILLWMSMGAPVFDFVDHDVLKLMWALTAFTTTASVGGYMYGKNAFRVTTGRKK